MSTVNYYQVIKKTYVNKGKSDGDEPITLLGARGLEGIHHLLDLYGRCADGDETQWPFDLLGGYDTHLAGINEPQSESADAACIQRHLIVHLFHEIDRLGAGRIFAISHNDLLDQPSRGAGLGIGIDRDRQVFAPQLLPIGDLAGVDILDLFPTEVFHAI